MNSRKTAIFRLDLTAQATLYFSMKSFSPAFLVCLLFSTIVIAQPDGIKGKIISNYGETLKVSDIDIETDVSAEFKVIFDVAKSSDDKSIINKYIITAARFLNMHADAGMDTNQLKVAITIHGGAWQDVLSNEAYREKFGVDNPNVELINQLTEAGADIIICGQTAEFHGITKQNANPNVKFALSAMTALLQYQQNGYTFIKF
ncbi:MAG: intracellular sulfur oxidation DsrE/DsrF family protein [Sediminicola sp.]|jgi:intracellular sulfur oxidation DsrE/DsrF family protein